MEPLQQRDPYSVMARVYDRWMEEDRPPYDSWVSYIVDEALRLLPEVGRPPIRLLEIGCGTGLMTERFLERSWLVTGLDASYEMISQARNKELHGATFHCTVLPDEMPRDLGAFDVAVACFDTLNYFTEASSLGDLFQATARMLAPGGVLVFDLNTRYKLEVIFGQYHSGDDFDDFAYVWRNRYSASEHLCRILLSFFIRSPSGGYERFTEHHVQRWYGEDEVQAMLDGAGLSVRRITDSYTDRQVSEHTRRMTWTAQKPFTMP